MFKNNFKAKDDNSIVVPPNRPAFHVDETLREAARRAKAAFDEEEAELKKDLMNEWIKNHAQAA